MYWSPAGHGQTADEDAPLGPFRTQRIALEEGWNAVYLEVEPLENRPDALLAETPVEIMAAYFRPVTSMEFIDSPEAVLSDRARWSVWYAPDREDALLSNLYYIQGHQPYLVYAEEDYTWELRGAPVFGTPEWHPDAFSMVGFPIDPAEKPTVANYFGGSSAHEDLRAYRMSDGRWSLIDRPESTLMEPGTAYWVFSEGKSDFRGPLRVEFPKSSSGGIALTESSGPRRVTLRNVTEFPQELSFSLTGGRTGAAPLAYEVRVLNDDSGPLQDVAVPFPETMTLGPLEPGQVFALDLLVDPSAVEQPLQSALLTIRSDAGAFVEIPIVVTRRDLLD